MNCVGLIVFCIGGGSKLLQSQLDQVRDIPSIPGYPLKYFYKHWDEWICKFKKLDSKLVLKLIIKHHGSIIDTRLIPGNNGLRNLGKKRNQYIEISKKNFSKNFLKFLNNKEVNSKNVILAIHFAYFLAKKKNYYPRNFLFHIHEAEYFNNYAIYDFKNMKLLVCCRDPINYFWKKIKLDKNIERKRFNFTDRILLRQNDYINSLDSIFCGFNNLKKNFFKKYHFIKFEDLKSKNYETLLKVAKYLKIKITKKKISPSFGGLEWWSDKTYDKYHKKAFDSKVYDYSSDKVNFFMFEIFILKQILNSFFLTAGYKNLMVKKNFISSFLTILLIFLPTKLGFKNLFFYLNPRVFLLFMKYNFLESFGFIKLKNYYFHAMYKHKKQYSSLNFMKFNFLRKFIFMNKKDKLIKFIASILNFIFYFGLYISSFFNLILLYFRRVFFLLENLVKLKKFFYEK